MADKNANDWLFEQQGWLEDHSRADLISGLIQAELDKRTIAESDDKRRTKRKIRLTNASAAVSMVIAIAAFAKTMGVF